MTNNEIETKIKEELARTLDNFYDEMVEQYSDTRVKLDITLSFKHLAPEKAVTITIIQPSDSDGIKNLSQAQMVHSIVNQQKQDLTKTQYIYNTKKQFYKYHGVNWTKVSDKYLTEINTRLKVYPSAYYNNIRELAKQLGRSIGSIQSRLDHIKNGTCTYGGQEK